MKNVSGEFMVRSKTEQALQYMRGMIESGGLKPGEQLLPEHRMAERLDVSVITVRRALEDLVREGLVYKVRGRGNFVAEKDSHAGDGLPGALTLVYPDNAKGGASGNVFLSPVIEGAGWGLAERGRILGLMPFPADKSISWLLSDKARRLALKGGMILVNCVLSRKDSEALKSFGAPTVVIGKVEKGFCVPSIDVDHFKGGRMLAEHLMTRHGRRRMLFVCRPERPYTEDILAGFRSAFSESGLDFEAGFSAIPLEEGLDAPKIVRRLEREAKTLGDCDAIVCQGDDATMGTLKVLERCGVEIPRDASLAAYGNHSAMAGYFSTTITDVQQPVRELGRRAAALLLKTAREGGPWGGRPERIVLDVELIVRESCGCGR